MSMKTKCWGLYSSHLFTLELSIVPYDWDREHVIILAITLQRVT